MSGAAPPPKWRSFSEFVSDVAWSKAESRAKSSAVDGAALAVFSGFEGGFVYAARTRGEAQRMHDRRPVRHCGSWF